MPLSVHVYARGPAYTSKVHRLNCRMEAIRVSYTRITGWQLTRKGLNKVNGPWRWGVCNLGQEKQTPRAYVIYSIVLIVPGDVWSKSLYSESGRPAL